MTPRGAAAESTFCTALREQIARYDNDANAARSRAAAAKQKQEVQRMAVYGHQIGCDRQQFLFFGDAPPAKCAEINARLNQMRNTLAALDQQGDGRRQGLLARYDSECRARPMTARLTRPPNFFEQLFGLTPPDETDGLREGAPFFPDSEEQIGESQDGRARAGSQAICVRSCDGGFFPVSYSARSANLDDLANQCRALCPNAETTLYTKSPWKDVDTAVSLDGAPYSEHPNALKFQTSHDNACGCKPPDKTWAEALADAEALLAANNNKDVVVTAEQAEQLSRPVAPGASISKAKKKASMRQDALISVPDQAPATQADPVAEKAENAPNAAIYKEIIGPDGVKRRVRVVAPSL
jgi:hypothetical protein